MPKGLNNASYERLAKVAVKKLTQEQFDSYSAKESGYCDYCRRWTRDSGVPGSAQHWNCPECGNATEYGADAALSAELLYIVD